MTAILTDMAGAVSGSWLCRDGGRPIRITCSSCLVITPWTQDAGAQQVAFSPLQVQHALWRQMLGYSDGRATVLALNCLLEILESCIFHSAAAHPLAWQLRFWAATVLVVLQRRAGIPVLNSVSATNNCSLLLLLYITAASFLTTPAKYLPCTQPRASVRRSAHAAISLDVCTACLHLNRTWQASK